MRTTWPHAAACGGALLLLSITACAGRTPQGEAPAPLAGARQIVATQLSRWADLPLDDALDRADPLILRRDFRGRGVLVYIDRMPSTFDDLHQIPTWVVAEVKLMAEDEAQMELGPLIWQPVLAVRLRHSE